MRKEGKMTKAKRHTGVYSRVSEGERLFNGKPDVCFYFTYKNKKDSRLVWEKAGWASEEYSPQLAAHLRAERLRNIRHGQELPKERKKIPQFLEVSKEYLRWGEKNKAKPKNDYYLLNKHLWDFFGNKKMNEISSFDLERVKNELTKKDLSPAYVKHALILIRQIYNKANQWNLYKGENPVKGVKIPSFNNQRERFLSYDEADKLLKELAKVSQTTHDQALLSLHCGLRAGEIFNLRGQDIDFANGLIRIMNPKNKASRAAYMTQGVKEMLKENLPESLSELIFKDRWHGEPIKNISKTFDRTVKSLGLNKDVEDTRQKTVFHTLRHTFASWLAIQGTPILTIKELLGHKTLAMTERYAHLSPDVKKKATLALEASFNESRDGRKVIPLAIAKEVSVSK